MTASLGGASGKPSGIGAFFDFDSTILPAPSLEWRFVGFLLERHQLNTAHATSWLAHFAKNILLRPHEATDANKQYLAGLRESLGRDWALAAMAAYELAEEPIFFPDAMARIAWHQSQGHRVCIVSGTLAVLAREILHRLPAPIDMIATELETAQGFLPDRDQCEAVWTGNLTGEHMTGRTKARAVRHFARKHELELSECYAYGDCRADLPMLECVGNPIAVNPSKRLHRIALENGWQSVCWKPSNEPRRIPAGRDPMAPKAAL
jgi:HAD superfamily hydrolase (TIGR01490 family)